MSFSVIIPSRTVANLAACVHSIRLANEKCRIIVVDDYGKGILYGTLDSENVTVVPGIKYFIFARNINLGIAAAGDDDVILLNDDTRLQTEFGFSYLASIAKANPEYGIISAAITAAVGNLEQIVQPGTRLREASHHTLVFVCVYIRRAVLDQLRAFDAPNAGNPTDSCEFRPCWLDERFVGYGYDDDDVCERVRRLNLKLGIFDGCVVEHGVLPSTYRGEAGATMTDLKPNRDRFIEKWGFAPGQKGSHRIGGAPTGGPVIP